jgi:hypothetical protein
MDEQLNRMAGVSRPAKTFTPKQGQYLAFIHLYTRLHRRPPAETDMQEYFRVSPPSVHQMVLTLDHVPPSISSTSTAVVSAIHAPSGTIANVIVNTANRSGCGTPRR